MRLGRLVWSVSYKKCAAREKGATVIQGPVRQTSLSVLSNATLTSLQLVVPTEQLAEIYREFLTHTRERLTRCLADPGKEEQLAFEAHALKGSAAMLGAVELSNLAADFEVSLTRGKIESELHNLLFAVERLQNSLHAAKVIR